MKSLIIAALTIGSLVGHAETLYITFDLFNNLGDTATVSVYAEAIGGGAYHAYSGTAALNFAAASYTNVLATLLPAGPGTVLSPSGLFLVNNVVYVPPADPVLDYSGLLFIFGTDEINIWGNGPDNYSLYVGRDGGYVQNDPWTLVPDSFVTPEPMTFVLMGTGLAAVGLLRRRTA